MNISTSKYAIVAIISLFVLVANAQTKHLPYFQDNNFVDLGTGAGKNIYSGSLSWYHLHPIGKKKQRFTVGYGVRLTSVFGKNQDHITAPATLTSKEQGPQVLFSKTYNENLDTLTVKSLQANSVNISINLQYNLNSKFSFGANIDAVGFTFGKSVTGTYQSSISDADNTIQSASPTPFNLLLVSDNDYGTLNSEFYAKYNFNEKIGIRAGYEFLFTEYTTDQKLALDNDRYRAKYQMAFIAITYRLKTK